jgi:putative transposase
MARAKRHYIPGHVWHITHRCHKREFLLKFVRDRRRYLQWLWEAKKRYGLMLLNYMLTSNHIHLLVVDDGDRDVIPRSVQLVAGRTGQEYNQRKGRKGAFWEDRYHATAIETGEHLLRCMVYIDLNMVRAGVVAHPSEWVFSGFREIQEPRRKCALIADERLHELTGFGTSDELRTAHRFWIEALLEDGTSVRESKWTRSIAVGSEEFIEATIESLGQRAKGRKVLDAGSALQLREPEVSYRANFGRENEDIGVENTYFWNTIYENSIT